MPARAEDEPSVELWPEGDAPGSEGQIAPEQVDVRYPGFRPGWQGDAAGERIVSQVHRPSITPFLPAEYSAAAPCAAVVVIPGGGHQALCFDLEGTFVGRWLAERGVAAFVLKYRLSEKFGDDAPESPYELEHSVVDTQRAIRVIRSRAAEWFVDPARVGVIGFSAGGYPAAHAALRGEDAPGDEGGGLEHISPRPDFQALVYPHMLGVVPHGDCPPAFLLAATDDGGGGDDPSFEPAELGGEVGDALARLFLRFREAGVSVELHMFAQGAHGFGLRPLRSGPVHHWPERFLEWLEATCPPSHLRSRPRSADSFVTHGRL